MIEIEVRFRELRKKGEKGNNLLVIFGKKMEINGKKLGSNFFYLRE